VTFPYKVCLPAPNGATCDTAVQTIIVGPDAVNDTFATPTDTTLTTTVVTNDEYAPNSVFSTTYLMPAAQGTLVFNPDGSFTYDPAPTFAGVVTFNYSVCLPAPNGTVCDTATVTIVVGPNAVDDADTIGWDVTLDDTVATNDAFPATSVFSTTNALSIPAAGSLSFLADGSFTFDPAATFSGVVSFPYQVCLPAPDGTTCDTAVQTITVGPNAVNDAFTTPADVTVVDTVATNDVFQVGSVFSTTGPLSTPAAGVLTFNPDGSFTFDPVATFAGVVTFSYQVCLPAPNGTVCDPATVTIVVGPDAVNDADTVAHDTTLVDTVATNDVFAPGSVFSTAYVMPVGQGTLVLGANGGFTYDPAATFSGVVSVPYTVCLPAPNGTVCDSAVQTIVVGPDAVNDSFTTPADTTVVDTVATNDVFQVGSVLSTTGVLSVPTAGVLTFGATGGFTFDPVASFAGVVTFPYTVCLPSPNGAVCDSAVATIVVGPDAVNDSDTVAHDTNLSDTVATNDIYQAGSAFTTTGLLSNPAAGALTFNSDGSFVFDPAATFAGVVTFPYTVCLPAPNGTVCDSAVQTIIVGPNAVNDSFTTPADTTVVDTVVTNDVYAVNSVFSTSYVMPPTEGTLVFGPTGAFTFNPAPTFSGVVTIPYTVCLPAPNTTVCDSATLTIVVGPDAVDDGDTVAHDVTLSDSVVGNDVYPVNSVFSTTGGLSIPTAGSLTFAADGSFSFDPAPTFSGVVTFPYRVCMPSPNAAVCDDAVVTIAVAPDAVNDTDTVAYDTTLTDSVAGNDTYPTNSVFATTGGLSVPAAGSLSFSPDGSFVFDPSPTFAGVVTFPYKVCLPSPNGTVCDTAVQEIVVGPDAVNDSFTTPTDTTLNDTVVDNDVYPVNSVFSKTGPLSTPSAGVVTFNSDGTFEFDPSPTFAGVVTFPYKVCLPAPNSAICDTATATIVVGPNAVDDTDSVQHDTNLSDSVAGNDVYPTNSVFSTTGGLSVPAAGSLSFSADGSFVFNPAATFAGIVTFPYKVCLPAPNTTVCDSAVQEIVVGPDAVDDSFTTPTDTTVNDSVVGNDVYPTNSVFSKTGPLSIPSAGVVTFNSDGSFEFDPAATFAGVVTFPYKVCVPSPNATLCDPAVVTIVIAPNAVDDTDTITHDFTLDDTVAVNDVYPAGSVFSKTGPLSIPAAGTVTFNADGSFTFDPATSFVGVVTFPYKVCLAAPNAGVCDTAVQEIIVGPDAVNDSDTVAHDTTLTDTVVTNDLYPGGAEFTQTGPLSDPSAGSLTFDGVVTFPYEVCLLAPNDTVCDGAVQEIIVGPLAEDDDFTTPSDTTVTDTVTGNDVYAPDSVFTTSYVMPATEGTLTFDADGSFVFDPASTFAGTVTIPYEVCLAVPNGSVCDPAVLTIKVTPEGVDDSVTTPTDTPVTTNVLTNDTSGPSLDLTEVTQGANGTVEIVDPVLGTVKYTPDSGFAGIDTYTYTACVPPVPQADTTLCVTQTVDVTITPTGEDDEATTPADTPVKIPVLDNDPSQPSVELTDATDPANGSVVINPDGTITYTPDPGFSGLDTFEYTACVVPENLLLKQPADEFCYTQTVTVMVLPEGVDDGATTPTDTPVDIPVLDNDNTVGLTVKSVTNPPNGSAVVNPDNTVTYTPDPGFSGTDTFEYTACDAIDQCITKTVEVIVTPVGTDDAATTPGGTPVNIPVLGNDPAGPSLTIQSTTPPTHGDVVINPDGTVTYTPDPGFSGIDTFTYTACDAENQCVTQTVTVTVKPVATDDAVTTSPGKPVVISVLGNDPAAPSVTVQSLTPPLHGTAVINPDGTITYTPNKGFSGVDTFTYTACDATGQCVTQAVMVTVRGIPNTGSDVGTSLALGALLVGAGGALVVGVRRRRRPSAV
jgi:LPXTG-motif cell wall-anchored protein